jgi:hypothetical protein
VTLSVSYLALLLELRPGNRGEEAKFDCSIVVVVVYDVVVEITMVEIVVVMTIGNDGGAGDG